jgi:hypothetical protein
LILYAQQKFEYYENTFGSFITTFGHNGEIHYWGEYQEKMNDVLREEGYLGFGVVADKCFFEDFLKGSEYIRWHKK